MFGTVEWANHRFSKVCAIKYCMIYGTDHIFEFLCFSSSHIVEDTFDVEQCASN